MTSALEKVLAHPDVRRLSHSLADHPAARIDAPEPVRRASVAVILRLGHHEALELLLIKRAEFAGDPWSGHVALPGGRREDADISPTATAVRETLEETAIDLTRDGSLIGALDELQPRSAILPPITIAPFVFVTKSDVQMVLSDEVADAFWVPLASLTDPQSVREIEMELLSGAQRVRSFGYGTHEIWGLTERILSRLLHVLDGGAIAN
ncbi:MAG: CoA pyrophosphatase [Anaerolineae bacterium]|nr:CoA pyrophosphatase [Gemmatimonadaceae bacterium]